MMNTLKSCFANTRSRVSRLFIPASQLATSQPAHPPQFSEEPDDYERGGFHAVSLGDKFNSGRYSVLRKLGYGQYSTVWLAEDLKCQQHVALKILRADCYGTTHDIFEREILSKVSEVSKNSSHKGRHHISHLLEQFNHTGPNGDHVCLVFDVLGHHLGFQVIKYKKGRLPIKTVKAITKQLLMGLDFLHRECGVIHTDLKPTNILLELEPASKTIAEYLKSVPPRTINRPDGTTVPLREVITTPLLSEMASPHIRIIDFGVSSWREKHLSDQIQPPALRAPEVTIGAPWDTGVDIWSLGCLVVEFVQGILLFSGKASENGTWTAEDDNLARISEVMGPFPTDFIQKGTRSAEFFDEQGSLLRIGELKPASLESLVNGEMEPFIKPYDMPEAEVNIFVDFIKGMLEIDPTARKSATELLQHEWLK